MFEPLGIEIFSDGTCAVDIWQMKSRHYCREVKKNERSG